jgi:hypothetical protein
VSLSKEETRTVNIFMDLHSVHFWYNDTSLMLSFLVKIVPLVYNFRQGDEATFKI